MQVALMREIEKQNSTAGLVYPSISYAISHACTRPHNGCKAIQYCSSNVAKMLCSLGNDNIAATMHRICTVI